MSVRLIGVEGPAAGYLPRAAEARPPSAESTALAWVCGAAEADVHVAARALGIRLSQQWYRSLRAMSRLAYALGTELQRVPARGARIPNPDGPARVLLWARAGGQESRTYILWGVDGRTGEVRVRPSWCVFDDEAPGTEGVADCTLLGAGMPNGLRTVDELVAWYAQPGCIRLHPCSWLSPMMRSNDLRI